MPRRRTSVFEKMFTDNRLRSIPNSEVQGTLCVEYWTSKILIELSAYKSLELDDVQEMQIFEWSRRGSRKSKMTFRNLTRAMIQKKATEIYLMILETVFFDVISL